MMFRCAILFLSCVIFSTAKILNLKYTEKSKNNDLEPKRLRYADLPIFRTTFFGDNEDELWVMDLDRDGLKDLKLRPGTQWEEMEFEDIYGHRIERYENHQKQIKALNQAISGLFALNSKLLNSTVPDVKKLPNLPSTESPTLSSLKPLSSEKAIGKSKSSVKPKKVKLNSKLLTHVKLNPEEPFTSMPIIESPKLSSVMPLSSESPIKKSKSSVMPKKVLSNSKLLASMKPDSKKPNTPMASSESPNLSSVKPLSSESPFKKEKGSVMPKIVFLNSKLLGSIKPNSEKPNAPMPSTESPKLSSVMPLNSDSPINKGKRYAMEKASVLLSRLLSSTESSIEKASTGFSETSSVSQLSSQIPYNETLKSPNEHVSSEKSSTPMPNSRFLSFIRKTSKTNEEESIKEEIMKIVNKFVMSAHSELNSNTASEEDNQEPSLNLYFKGPYTALAVRYLGNSWHYLMTPPSPLPSWFYEDLSNGVPFGPEMHVKPPKDVEAKFYKAFLHMIQMFLGFPV